MGLVVNKVHFTESKLPFSHKMYHYSKYHYEMGKGAANHSWMPSVVTHIQISEMLWCEDICVLESMKYGTFVVLSVPFISQIAFFFLGSQRACSFLAKHHHHVMMVFKP